jgi:hypothetical protein
LIIKFIFQNNFYKIFLKFNQSLQANVTVNSPVFVISPEEKADNFNENYYEFLTGMEVLVVTASPFIETLPFETVPDKTIGPSLPSIVTVHVPLAPKKNGFDKDFVSPFRKV